MLSKFVAAAVLGSALIAAPALAQSNNKMSPQSGASTKSEKTEAPAEKASASGMWQASKVVGLSVYNDQNQKIGSIMDLMMDKDGKIDAVVIGVGGFLGIGERDVKVKFSEVKFVNTPVPSTTSGNAGSSTTTRPATTGAASTSSNAPKTYPDHAVFNASKDQLKAMPQFDYNK